MDVSVGGVAVVNGSTLSATGEMQVSCNNSYVLTVDGVEWTPITSAGGVDKYLLSTSGVIRIFIGGTRYFLFNNVVESDFNAESVYLSQFHGQTRLMETFGRPYVQSVFRINADIVTVQIEQSWITTSQTADDLVALGSSANQGEVTIRKDVNQYGTFVTIDVANFDVSQYLAVFLGNVLLAFFEPVS